MIRNACLQPWIGPFFFFKCLSTQGILNCKGTAPIGKKRGSNRDLHRFSWIFNSPPDLSPTEQKHISCPISYPEKGCPSQICFSKLDAQQIKKTQLTPDVFLKSNWLLADSSRDLFIPKRWRSPTTFEGVTFSPSQKGHQQNCQVLIYYPKINHIINPIYIMGYNN